MSTLKPYGIVLIIFIVFFGSWAIYAKLSYRKVEPDTKGRIALQLGLVSIMLGMFSILIAIAFGYFTISAIFNPIDDRFLFLILGPPLTALMIFGAIIIFWTKLRVSKEGVEYRGVKGWEYFSWDQIKGVDTHAGLGPRINTINNRRLYFWPYGYGLEQLREIFVNHDKPFNVE